MWRDYIENLLIWWRAHLPGTYTACMTQGGDTCGGWGHRLLSRSRDCSGMVAPPHGQWCHEETVLKMGANTCCYPRVSIQIWPLQFTVNLLPHIKKVNVCETAACLRKTTVCPSCWPHGPPIWHTYGDCSTTMWSETMMDLGPCLLQWSIWLCCRNSWNDFSDT